MGLCCGARLLRRKALMEGSEAYFDVTVGKSSSFVLDIAKSKARNHKLREVIAFLFVVILFCNVEFQYFGWLHFQSITLVVTVVGLLAE